MRHLNIFILIYFASAISHGGIFGPDNYNECVAEGIKENPAAQRFRILKRKSLSRLSA